MPDQIYAYEVHPTNGSNATLKGVTSNITIPPQRGEIFEIVQDDGQVFKYIIRNILHGRKYPTLLLSPIHDIFGEFIPSNER